MYVCICNAFTEKAVRRTLCTGARTAAGVYRGLDCTPQCGKCVPYVRQMVRDHLDAANERRDPPGVAAAG